MPFVNQGNQSIFIDYAQAVDAEEVSRRLDEHLPPGIYSGGDVSIVSSTEVDISPVTMEVRDTNEQQVKVETGSTVTLLPSPSQPYLVFEWTRNNAEGWFGEFLVESAIPPSAVVFGKALFDNNGNLTGIDFSDRTIPDYKEAEFSVGVSMAGYVEYNRKSISSDYIVSQSDQLVAANHTSQIGIQLPTVSGQRQIIIKDEIGNAGAEPITISGPAGVSIDGNSSVQINQDYGSKELYFDGAEWHEL